MSTNRKPVYNVLLINYDDNDDGDDDSCQIGG